MTSPDELSFDDLLDRVFVGSSWLDVCVQVLSAFLEDIDSSRDNPGEALPHIAPSIVGRVAGIAERTQRLQLDLRQTAESRGPQFQTQELGATLWWVGMALHKAAGATESARDTITRNAWEDAFFEIHALLYDTMAAVSMLSVAEGMIRRMETDGAGSDRPN